MALQVWLPLNGNLDNKGLCNVSFLDTNASATISNNGKIGKCYSFSGYTGYGIYLNTATMSSAAFMNAFINNHSWTLCVWVKTTSTSTTALSLTYGLRIFVGQASATGVSLYNQSRTVACYANTAVNDGQWHHVAGSYNVNTNIISIYVDGELKNTNTYTAGYTYASSWVNNIHIGKNPNANNAIDSYFYQGDINDVRIYDHCLSPKEVKEISKALVLHYPLNNSSYTNTNLLPETSQRMTNEGQTSNNEYMSLCSPLSIFDTYGLVPYTVSFDIKAAVPHSFLLYGTPGSNPKYSFTSTYINVTTEWQRISYTFTPRIATETGTWASISVYGTYGSGAVVSVRRVKLELGEIETAIYENNGIIYDCSGYGNHGKLVGQLTIDKDTPKYNYCSYLAQSGAINCGRGGMVTDSITVNVWVKYSTYSNIVSCTESGGWNFENNSGLTFPIYIQSVGYVHITASSRPNPTIYANNWHMFTGIYDRINKLTKLYIDGVLIGTGTVSASNLIVYNASNVIWLNAEATSSNTTANYGNSKKYSDFRIYATALSDDDVKELYNTSAFIYNDGSVASYEFNENTGVPQSFKNGTFSTEDYFECMPNNIKVLDDGSAWLRILHHNAPATNLFTSSNCWNYESENLYSKLSILQNLTQTEYEFLVYEKLESSSAESEIRWKQTSNPSTTTSATGFTLISGTAIHLYPGLVKSGTQHGAIDINGNDWWCCCGCYTAYQGGIPGFGGVVKTGYMDLYIRIYNSDLIDKTDAAFYENCIRTNQLIEI